MEWPISKSDNRAIYEFQIGSFQVSDRIISYVLTHLKKKSFQIQSSSANLHECCTRSRGTCDILVLLRESTMVLCRKEANISRSPATGSRVAKEGLRDLCASRWSWVSLRRGRISRGYRRSQKTNTILLWSQWKMHVRIFPNFQSLATRREFYGNFYHT